MSQSPNLALPYILASQAQKHVTHNEAIRSLDCLVQLSVLSRVLSAPPGSPVDGDRYLVGPSPSGDWALAGGKVAAYQDGAWAFFAPRAGWIAWISDEGILAAFDGASWSAVSSSGVTDHGALTGLGDDDHPQYLNAARADARYVPVAPSMLGVNASADLTNRLAVSSAAALFNHAGSGHQLKINKNTDTATASFLFQTGFSGRAEIGTTGDDDFHFKVSADGSAWNEALKINRSTGEVTFPSVAQVVVNKFVASGTWTKPVGAKLCRVLITGGGGGGGGGGKAASGTAVTGGGGGGGGGRVEIVIDANDLSATETVTIGSGGSGGTGAVSNGSGGTGAAGGNTSFGSVVTAYGGGGGSGGNAAVASAGGGGGSGRAAGGNASGATAGSSSQSLAGAGGSGAAGGSSVGASCGAGGGGTTAAGAASNGGAAGEGGSAGGSGGGVTSANVFQAGGSGNSGHTQSLVAGGASDGTGGSNAATLATRAGQGGGGGAGSVSSNGGIGGLGGAPGGGGGGGGGAQGGNGGAGANGGRGEVLVITYR